MIKSMLSFVNSEGIDLGICNSCGNVRRHLNSWTIRGTVESIVPD